jgi:chorismate-pyruvate lyase
VANALTAALAQLGEAEPARALGQDTLQRCHQALGPDHSITLSTETTLTFTLNRLGEDEQARALGEDTLQRSRSSAGRSQCPTCRRTS